MKNYARTIWNMIKYDQKSEWDKIAYGFFKRYRIKQIIDAGCGEGRFLSQDPDNIIGLDWNLKSLTKCRDSGYEVIRFDVRSLPFKENSVPGIHCSHLIEHFSPQDAYKILSEFDRILEVGGVLIIRTPLLWDKFYSDFTHIKPYNPEAIIHYLTPSSQRTLGNISEDYSVVNLKWRYIPISINIKYVSAIFNVLSRWGFPWIRKNGYMLVLRKTSGDVLISYE